MIGDGQEVERGRRGVTRIEPRIRRGLNAIRKRRVRMKVAEVRVVAEIGRQSLAGRRRSSRTVGDSARVGDLVARLQREIVGRVRIHPKDVQGLCGSRGRRHVLDQPAVEIARGAKRARGQRCVVDPDDVLAGRFRGAVVAGRRPRQADLTGEGARNRHQIEHRGRRRDVADAAVGRAERVRKAPGEVGGPVRNRRPDVTRLRRRVGVGDDMDDSRGEGAIGNQIDRVAAVVQVRARALTPDDTKLSGLDHGGPRTADEVLGNSGPDRGVVDGGGVLDRPAGHVHRGRARVVDLDQLFGAGLAAVGVRNQLVDDDLGAGDAGQGSQRERGGNHRGENGKAGGSAHRGGLQGSRSGCRCGPAPILADGRVGQWWNPPNPCRLSLKLTDTSLNGDFPCAVKVNS